MKELIFSVTRKDLEITYYNGSGNGGQNRNNRANCVRIRHPESGVIATGQDERTKEQNLRNAFKRLAHHPKFRAWLKIKTSQAALTKEAKTKEEWEINKKVDEAMREENLKVEYF